MTGDPVVSVVIPTRGRPRQVAAAVRSALLQTLAELEVVVVLDGPDRGTRRALEPLAAGDPRVRVHGLSSPRGPGAARNAGVAAARAPWIALLDDDDLWHPDKLARQLPVALGAPHAAPIVATRLSDSSSGAVLPRRLPRPGEPLGDYLLARRGALWGEALVHTSTLLAPRWLLREVRFREDLPRHEDWDWLLRAGRAGAEVVFVDDARPLAVWSTDPGRPRASTRADWRESLAWARSARGLMSPRAYAGFLLGIAGADAARRRSPAGAAILLGEAVARGRPRVRDLAVWAGVWVVPESARRRAARAARRPRP